MAEIIQEAGVIERFATNIALLTGAIATLAESINGSYTKGTPIYAQTPAATEPTKVAKPRGRQAKGEENGVAVAPISAGTSTAPAQTATTPEVDPFDLEPKVPAKAFELTDVRNALIAYQKAKSPELARQKLKEFGGVDSLASLTTDKFQAVVDSLK